ncbi:hypothetical protein ADK41_17980 [Streptomyces caelestis]|uniref:Transposase n=2 Tax=Streptomyces TaxID=1883 RepID=A0A0M8QIS4_9ACTN|nr:hypothetical protein ADK41_17980 [Streptomyces caelestis]KOV23107.1 hypothetical protein ADK58_25915 [Streptomyces sp. XY152]
MRLLGRLDGDAFNAAVSAFLQARASGLDADGGGDAGMTPDEKEELRRLRRENARLKEDNEILRKTAAYFARETTR